MPFKFTVPTFLNVCSFIEVDDDDGHLIRTCLETTCESNCVLKVSCRRHLDFLKRTETWFNACEVVNENIVKIPVFISASFSLELFGYYHRARQELPAYKKFFLRWKKIFKNPFTGVVYVNYRRIVDPLPIEDHIAIQNIFAKPPPEPLLSLDFQKIPKDFEVSNDCCICLEAQDLVILECRHVVCFECLAKMLNTSCPICRYEFNTGNLKRK